MQEVPVFPFEAFFVKQAVFNLVNNALQAMREAEKCDRVWVRLEHSAEGEFPEGGFVRIEVEDNGPGMPPHILKSILDGRSITTRKNGSGVGTRLVRDVVLTHGGELTAESSPDRGTVFRLKLPMQRVRP
jgi:signal transduction histidine kinase